MRTGPVLAMALAAIAGAVWAGSWAPPGSPGDGDYTRASNRDSIVNTRHNLTFSYIGSGIQWMMTGYKNFYGEVCVYCHTPHGASSRQTAPLWNRTLNDPGAYTVYTSQTLISTDNPGPGPNSLLCLSCHDGTIAIDSIINMPGPGGYSAAQEATVNDAFLSTWDNGPSYIQAGFIFCGNTPCFHAELGSEGNPGEEPEKCKECHYGGNAFGLPDFTAFVIGTSLGNDHPVGVRYPDPGVYDFAPGMVAQGGLRFFDKDGDGRADPDEIRLYDNGSGPRVECASCHDPHGVDGGGGALIPSFLRVPSDGSQICLTCHTK
ncbi:cytochrome c3 family protein [Inmirania thermothiophila]|uniref:Doubled CXXCH motif protein n=1 Tax=Inmirania thermothiophila TaxID=1750597 RepID=A0A3N1Y0S9_9GAMM|nr:cytochrome c3 family protein [Inmirania thermothiophila]ROR32426.1 doubled CXXCH motif protein [Inmirania thermothiophila]